MECWNLVSIDSSNAMLHDNIRPTKFKYEYSELESRKLIWNYRFQNGGDLD